MKDLQELQGRGRSALRLTEIEKLDGSHFGLALQVKLWFDQGIEAVAIPAMVHDKYGVSITDTMAENFRSKVWAPEREGTKLRLQAARAIWELLGGNKGLDLMLFAQLFELLNTLEDVDQIVAVKDHLLKCRAQELKEEEFSLKSRQLKAGQPDDSELDPAAQELKRKQVMNKIRVIFGLKPLPMDTPDEDPEDGSEEGGDQSAEGSAQDDAVVDPNVESNQNPEPEPMSGDLQAGEPNRGGDAPAAEDS